jgi:hypothetical protein
VDAVEEADADLKDVAVLNPIPMIEAPTDAEDLLVNEPVFDDNCSFEPAAPTVVLSLSV